MHFNFYMTVYDSNLFGNLYLVVLTSVCWFLHNLTPCERCCHRRRRHLWCLVVVGVAVTLLHLALPLLADRLGGGVGAAGAQGRSHGAQGHQTDNASRPGRGHRALFALLLEAQDGFRQMGVLAVDAQAVLPDVLGLAV